MRDSPAFATWRQQNRAALDRFLETGEIPDPCPFADALRAVKEGVQAGRAWAIKAVLAWAVGTPSQYVTAAERQEPGDEQDPQETVERVEAARRTFRRRRS